jgi:hypothetical protein
MPHFCLLQPGTAFEAQPLVTHLAFCPKFDVPYLECPAHD